MPGKAVAVNNSETAAPLVGVTDRLIGVPRHFGRSRLPSHVLLPLPDWTVLVVCSTVPLMLTGLALQSRFSEVSDLPSNGKII